MKLEVYDIEMVQGLVLAKLYKPRSKKELQSVLDDEKNKGKDPKKDIMALKTVEQKVFYNIQTAQVLAICKDNPLKLEVGDIMVIDYRRIKEFDMFKNTFLINTYDIIGKVNDKVFLEKVWLENVTEDVFKEEITNAIR